MKSCGEHKTSSVKQLLCRTGSSNATVEMKVEETAKEAWKGWSKGGKRQVGGVSQVIQDVAGENEGLALIRGDKAKVDW